MKPFGVQGKRPRHLFMHFTLMILQQPYLTLGRTVFYDIKLILLSVVSNHSITIATGSDLKYIHLHNISLLYYGVRMVISRVIYREKYGFSAVSVYFEDFVIIMLSLLTNRICIYKDFYFIYLIL